MAQSVLEIIINAKDNASKSLKGINIDMKQLGAASAAAGAAITAALGATIKSAADAQQASQAFTSLTKSIGTVKTDALEELRKSTRGLISDTDLMKAGNKFMAMGLATSQDEMSKLAGVAARLGSAMGSGPTESMENFALMMANQSIPRLDSFGISSGKVRQRIDELMAANVNLTREQAFNTAVMEQADVTLQKLGEPLDTTADKMARVQANIENMKVTIGDTLLPILEPLLAKLGEMVVAVSKWTQENPKLTETIVTVLAIMGPLMVALPILVAMFLAITSPVGLVIIAFGLLVTAGVLLYQNWELIKAKAAEVWAAIVATVKGKIDSIIAIANGFKDAITGAFSAAWSAVTAGADAAMQGLKDTIAAAANWIIGKVNTMINAINSVTSAGAGIIGASAPQISNIPALADGGIVTKPTLALIGEAGPEAVVPLSKGGAVGIGGNTNVAIMQGANITITGQGDERRLAQTISKELARVIQNQNNGLATAL